MLKESREKGLEEKFFLCFKIILAASLLAPILISKNTLFPALFIKGIYFRVAVEIALAAYFSLLLFSKNPRAYLPKTDLIFWAIAGYTAVLAISSAFGINPYRSFWGTIERMDGLFTNLHLFAFFIMARSAFQKKIDWLWIFRFLTGLSVVLALGGLAEASKIFSFYSDPNDVRVSSFFGNPIFYANYIVFILFFTAILFFWEKDKRIRALLASVSILNLLMLGLTGTRSAWIAFGISTLGVLLSWLFFSSKENRRFRLKILLGTMSVFLLFLGFIAASQKQIIPKTLIFHRYEALWREAVSMDNSRYPVWALGIKAWKKSPAFGFGPESFSYIYDKFYHRGMEKRIPESIFFDRSHNRFVDALAMTGIIGLAFLFFIFLAPAILIFRFRKQFSFAGYLCFWGLAAHAIQLFFGFDVITSSQIFFLFVGFISSATIWKEEKTFEDKKPFIPKLWRQALAGAIWIGLIFLALWSHLPNLKSNWGLIDFYTLSNQNKKTEAYQVLSKTLSRRYYGTFEMYYYAGEALNSGIQENNIEDMNRRKSQMEKVADYMVANYNPKDILGLRSQILASEIYKNLYHIDQNPAWLAKAGAIIEKAVSFNPDFLAPRRILGQNLIMRGLENEGLKKLDEVFKVDDRKDLFYQWAGIGFLGSGDKKKATEYLFKGLETSESMQISIAWKIAAIYDETKDYKKLEEFYAWLFKKLPGQEPTLDHAKTRAFWAITKAKLGKYKEAKSIIFDSMKIYPTLAKQYEETIKEIERIEQNSKQPAAR